MFPGVRRKGAIMTEPDLSDPDYARFAWGRYKRLMVWMVLAATVATVGSLGALWWWQGPLPWIFVALAAGGVFFSVMLGAALMGLVFLSSGTGHDDTIQDFSADEHE